MKRSKWFEGVLCLDHNINMIENKIDILLHEINLKYSLSRTSIKEFNKLDCEVVIALMNAKLESAKGIQFSIMFCAFLFVTLTGLVELILNSKMHAYIYVGFTAVISISIFERSYRNQLLNYTYLKELLLIYKNEKFKDEEAEKEN